MLFPQKINVVASARHANPHNETVVVQNDTAVEFYVAVVGDNGQTELPEGATYTLVCLHLRKQPTEKLGTLQADGNVMFKLTHMELSETGPVQGQVRVYHPVGGRLTSNPFIFHVAPDPTYGAEIKPEDQSIIEQVIGEGPAIIAEAKEETEKNITERDRLTGAVGGALDSLAQDKADALLEMSQSKTAADESAQTALQAADNADQERDRLTQEVSDKITEVETARTDAEEATGEARSAAQLAIDEADAARLQKVEVADILGAGPVASVNGKTGVVDGLATQESVNQVTAQLAEKALKSEVRKDTATQPIDVDEMNTRTKQLFTGGAVAVVGENAVGNENVKPKAITYDKVDFAKEVARRVENIAPSSNFATDTDGNGFADGWAGGSSNISDPRIANNTQYWTPQVSGVSGALQSVSRVGVIEGHKYYIGFSQSNVTSLEFSVSNERFVDGLRIDGEVSAIHTASTTNEGFVRIRARKTEEETSVKKLVIVDLTEAFGAGNEPDKEYFGHLLSTFASGWFDGVLNLTDATKNAIVTAKDLNVYDPDGVIGSENVNDALINLADGVVKAVSGKNLYNPNNNFEGTISTTSTYSKQELITGTTNHVSQRLKITNKSDVTLSEITAYSITDENDFVLKYRSAINRAATTLRASEIPEENCYLWVSVRLEDVNAAQIELGSQVTPYEPYKAVDAVYANGVKLFDFPLTSSIGEDKKKELYDLAKAELGSQNADELISFLTRNATVGNEASDTLAKDSQTLPLVNSGEQKLILHLHKRTKEEGFGVFNNAYLPNAKDDFSDVRIIGDNGEVLPYRVTHVADDFDIVPYDWTREADSASPTFTDSAGNLYQSDRHIKMSRDKGNTWTDLPAFLGFSTPIINLIAQDDTMYFNKGNVLYRSPAPYTEYQAVFDLDPNGVYGNVRITGKGLVQHPDGELFCGLYQDQRRINLFKSVDNGLTWQLSADWGDSYQHVHGMFVDKYSTPPAVYAGLDQGGGVLKSTDKGLTWIDLREQFPDMPQATDYGVRYADPSGYRLLGGETPIMGGVSIIKTFDDATFKPVLTDGISVNYVVKLGDRLFSTGSGGNGFRNGAIYISRDEAETWEGVYRTAPLLDLWSANDGYRYMEKMSGDEIFVGPQSFSRPPLRIFGEGNYAELIVDIPSGVNSITVESGHAYPNQLPIINNADATGEKLVHFELNERTSVIKELVSGEYFEGEFEWVNGGKRLSYFYPYISSPLDRNSVTMKSLKGFKVDATQFDVAGGITISFWSKMSEGTRLLLVENGRGDKLEITSGYQLRLNNVNTVSFNYPVIPEPFIKHDILVANDGNISVYTNGLLRTLNGNKGIDILNALKNNTFLTFLRGNESNDGDAIQHFMIRKGLINADQLLKEFNAGITDNISSQ